MNSNKINSFFQRSSIDVTLNTEGEAELRFTCDVTKAQHCKLVNRQ